jgi:hypothetical protein
MSTESIALPRTALLTEHQKELAKAMEEGMRNGEESGHPAPSKEPK